ncbi:hypothetical protein C8F01DRAFT_1147031 [Mycena amicta]|nr:hypothetical protein C8F01DRAFT_1147031 [Mycena amicta]
MSATNLDTMPPEIVSQIFLACLPSTPARRPTTTTAPLLITQICTLWRAIALDTPALWSTVVLDDDLDASTDILHLWSARARTLPVTYVIRTTDIDMGEEMLEAATQYEERWEDVELHLPAPAYHALVPRLSGTSFPHLCRLSLHAIATKTGEFDALPTLDFSGGAPKLVELRLLAYPHKLADNVPWGQLRTLQIDGTFQNVAILRSCPSLVHLVLNPPPIASEEVQLERDVVPLPHLESLALLANTGLAPLLSLPRLCHLEIPLTEVAVHDIVRLLPRWGATTLTSLTVYLTTAHLALSTLFTALPQLKTLHCDFAGGHWRNRYPDPTSIGLALGFVTGLLELETPEVLLPELETLRITWPQPVHTILFRLLSNRNRGSFLPGVLHTATLVLPGCEELEASQAEAFRMRRVAGTGLASAVIEILGVGDRILFKFP